MRRRVTVFVIAALVVGVIAISQSNVDAAARTSQLAYLKTAIDNPHAKRPAAANFELIAHVSQRKADNPTAGSQPTDPAQPGTAPASTTSANDTVQAQSVTFSPEAVLFIQNQVALQRQFYEAMQRAAMQDFFEGVYVADGWSRFGSTLACVRNRESHGNYAAVNRRSRAAGAYQFLQGTWNSTAARAGRPDLVGVFPAAARPLDQDYLAVHLMDAQGYAPWVGGRACR